MAGFGQSKETNKKKKQEKKTRNFSKAEKVFQEALSQHIQGDFVNAEKSYRKGVEAGFLHCGILSNLGVICHNTGRAKEAIIFYKQAISLDSTNPNAT